MVAATGLVTSSGIVNTAGLVSNSNLVNTANIVTNSSLAEQLSSVVQTGEKLNSLVHPGGDGGDLGWCLVVVVHQLKGEYARGPTTHTHHLQKVAIIFISDKIC